MSEAGTTVTMRKNTLKKLAKERDDGGGWPIVGRHKHHHEEGADTCEAAELDLTETMVVFL